MKEGRKEWGLALACMFAFILVSYSVSFSTQLQEAEKEGATNHEKTKEQDMVFRSKFESLSTEYQEKARRLGYKEGDMVETRKDKSGALTFLPPLQEVTTPEKMKEKLFELVSTKIAQKTTDDVQFSAMLAEDLSEGYFTAKIKLSNLYPELKEQAKKLGYGESEIVPVQVDAITWEYHILGKEKEPKMAGYLQEIIAPKEAGGSPSFRMAFDFEGLPEFLQQRAKEKGYARGEMVRFIYDEGSKEYEILPPLLNLGKGYNFAELEKKEQKIALKLGYNQGDKVWKTFDDNLKMVIVPAAKAGSGPALEIKEMLMDTSGKEIIFICITRFEMLGGEYRQQALDAGYKEGDKIWVDLRFTFVQAEIKRTIKIYPLANIPKWLLEKESPK